MANIILSFIIGCIVTYLVTIITSALKASTVLEEAMLTYALLLMSAYEISVNQIEQNIVAARIDNITAENIRRVNKGEFEKFANSKIKEILALIPTSHLNIIRYKNFKEMNLYITKEYGRRNGRVNKKI
ncbi:MAG: hypothetical protein ACR2ON_05445 [Paracoccaceae bacterium]